MRNDIEEEANGKEQSICLCICLRLQPCPESSELINIKLTAPWYKENSFGLVIGAFQSPFATMFAYHSRITSVGCSSAEFSCQDACPQYDPAVLFSAFISELSMFICNMIEFFLPNSRALYPLLVQIAQMDLILPRWGLILPRIHHQPLFFTQPS